MEHEDDPYVILGVSRDANDSQIRSAYRKAALRSHPDKVAVEQRAAATVQFAKISNAYEILSDPHRRTQYDTESVYRQRQQEQQQQEQQQSYRTHRHPFANDDFFSFGFHDPFQVFHSVFREEFGGSPNFNFAQRSVFPMMRPQPQRPPSSVDSFFGNDPFFQNHRFGGGGSLFGDDDDFFFGGSSLFGPGRMGDSRRVSNHRRRPSRDPFEEMHASMDAMRRQMEEQIMRAQQRHHYDDDGTNYPNDTRANGITAGPTTLYYSSSTTTGRGGGGAGETVTTQTTRRIVNGREKTVTERIVQKADGSVERQVLDSSSSAASPSQYALPEQSHEQGEQRSGGGGGFSRLLPWQRRQSRRNTTGKDATTAEDLTPSKRSPAETDSEHQKRRREP